MSHLVDDLPPHLDTPSQTALIESREESPPRPLDATFPPRPRTPPSTPTSGPTSLGGLSDPLMFELTRSKLERAAQGQMTGRRGAPSLRQLVLLSNVWGASQWREEQEREREVQELDRRRKEDEERWLDGVLQEMLVEDGSDDEDEYVELSFRGERDFGDSGFLEEDRDHASKKVLGLEMERIDEELEYREPSGSREVLDDELSSPSTLPSPPSPPLPPRSPPIDLPEPSSLYSSHELVDFSSPPLYPPSLTPDCSPPGLGAASDLLGTSADSIQSFEDHRYDWIEERLSKRLGLLALDLPPTPSKCTPSYPSTTMASSPLDIASLTHRTSFESLSFGPSTPPRPSLSPLLPPSPHPPSPDSLSLVLVHQSRHWSPRPPRSLSVPPTPRPRTHRPPSHPFPSFSGGIVKSFYDCVDFGSAPPRTAATQTDDEGLRGREDSLALVLAQPKFPGLHELDFDAPIWRPSRSLSPDGGRRQWATLSDVVVDGDGDD